MSTKLELPTVIRQIQSSPLEAGEKQRLIGKATACLDERQLIEVQNELFRLGGGRTKMVQGKIATVKDTR